MNLIQHAVDLGVPEGISTVLASHPFDTVKVRMQTIGVINYWDGEFLYDGPIDCFQKIIKREGFWSLYRGMSLPLITTVPTNILTFYTYNVLAINQLNGGKKMTRKEVLLGGAISGGLPALIISPIERIKFYLQIPNGYYGTVTTPTVVIKRIYYTEGIRGFYRGTVLCIARDSINTAIAFLSYYWLKLHVFRKHRYSDEGPNRPYGKRETYSEISICGGIAGLIATIFTIPFDFLKTRTQFNPVPMSEIINDIKLEAERRHISVMRLSYTGTPLILTRNLFHYSFMFLGFEVYKNLVRRNQVLERFEKDGVEENDREVQEEIEMLEKMEEEEYEL